MGVIKYFMISMKKSDNTVYDFQQFKSRRIFIRTNLLSGGNFFSKLQIKG